MNANAEISIVREIYVSYLFRYEWYIRPTHRRRYCISFLSHAIQFGNSAMEELIKSLVHTVTVTANEALYDST